MIVAELIEALRDLPQELPVVACIAVTGEPMEITGAKVVPITHTERYMYLPHDNMKGDVRPAVLLDSFD